MEIKEDCENCRHLVVIDSQRCDGCWDGSKFEATDTIVELQDRLRKALIAIDKHRTNVIAKWEQQTPVI